MRSKILNFNLVLMLLAVSACVVAPAGYYDGGPGPGPDYGYYGYGPAYPWNTGVDVDIIGGYGRGGYGRGGYGHGGYGGGRSGGRAGVARGGGGGLGSIKG